MRVNFLQDLGHDEYIEPEILSVGLKNITPKMLVDAVVDYDYFTEDSSLDQLPEEFLAKSLDSKILSAAIEKSDYGIRDALAYFPIASFTPAIKKKLINKDSDAVFYMPRDVVTPKDIVYALQDGTSGSVASDWVDTLDEYFLENNSNQLNWNQIIDDHGSSLPHLDNPEVQKVFNKIANKIRHQRQIQAAELERSRPERERAEAELRVKQQEEVKKKIQDILPTLSKNPENISKIPKEARTPELIMSAIRQNPKVIFSLSSDERTKEYWLAAVRGLPSMIDYVRPFDLQTEIKNELSVNEDIAKIKNLSGL